MAKNTQVAIRVDHVSKAFKPPQDRASSLKGIFTNPVRMLAGKKSSHLATPVLRDVSFEIKKGEFFGIVGRNGSGKSTLLKLLAGIYQPTSGSVRVTGRLVPFIELGVGFNVELSGRENIYLNGALLGFTRKEIEAKYDEIVTFAELEDSMEKKLKNYSSGMQVRLAFSVATKLAESDILLVDEVLAVGDASFQRKCFDYFKSVKKEGKTVVFVSHDMGAVQEYCDRAVLIEEGKVIHSGLSAVVAHEYSKLFIEEQPEEEKRQADEKDRWGNGDVRIESVEPKITKDTIDVSIVAKVNKDVDCLIYGIHFVAADGVEVVAMNNRMVQSADLRNLKKGQVIKLKWSMLNILNDGSYDVTITLINDRAEALDWFVGATRLSIRKMSRSTTYILPPIEVTTKISN